MRTKNSLYNLIGAFAGQTAGIIAQFASRVIFLKCLNTTYLGVSGLFTNILSVLSLMELGAGTALTFSLYKPLAVNNTVHIKSLMELYKKIYTAIGAGILILGFILTPAYPFFMDEIPDIAHLTFIYWLFVFNTAVTYFYSYKKILIICDQKRYLYSIFHYGTYAVICAAQSVVLLLTGNYILYLLCVTVLSIGENIVLTKIADHMYPYIKTPDIKPLPVDEQILIKRNISSMLLHKIGGIVVSSTDNIVISKFLGLAVVGVYSNYYLIVDALYKITAQVFNSVIASIGNLLVEDNKHHIQAVFYRIFFMAAWIFGLCTICLLVLFQPFIELYAGAEYLLNHDIVVIICLNFYITGIRKAVLAFRDASATYYYDRYKAVIEAIINLISSIILVNIIGLSGVFLGTIISALLISIWVEPLVLCRYVLRCSVKEYLKRLLMYSVVTLVCAVVVLICCANIKGNTWTHFFLRAFLSFILTNIFFLFTYRKTDELQYFLVIVKKFINAKCL